MKRSTKWAILFGISAALGFCGWNLRPHLVTYRQLILHGSSILGKNIWQLRWMLGWENSTCYIEMAPGTYMYKFWNVEGEDDDLEVMFRPGGTGAYVFTANLKNHIKGDKHVSHGYIERKLLDESAPELGDKYRR